MLRFLFCFFSFCFVLFSCNNTIPAEKNNFIKPTDGEHITFLKKTNRPYVLKKTLIIPPGKTLCVGGGVKIIFKKGGEIINNGGSFFVGKDCFLNNPSGFYSFDLNGVWGGKYDVEIYSKKPGFI